MSLLMQSNDIEFRLGHFNYHKKYSETSSQKTNSFNTRKTQSRKTKNDRIIHFILLMVFWSKNNAFQNKRIFICIAAYNKPLIQS